MADFRSGFVAVVGRPNVGKSTLVNALVGEKVSIVTAKPQTTRQRILGIRSRADSQIIFVDTPGLHATARKLINRAMNRAATGSLVDADLVLFVIEGQQWRGGDSHVLERLAGVRVPVVLVVNKVDLVRPRSVLLPLLEDCQKKREFAAIVPVCAQSGDNLETLMTVVLEHLPTGAQLYPQEMRTDRGRDFRIGEVLREKLMAALDRELPYGLAVEILAVDQGDSLVRIAAQILVAKASQRPIVIGRGGETLKAIGQAARIDLEQLLGRKVFLQTHVRVRRNWADDARSLRQLGYDAES
ncbi:MAG: GTPase Era [Gammaproteobacteria bacterium]|nr:GTPase Era [Gammaproteobacteria bacterium]